jgi:hypothetical protein
MGVVIHGNDRHRSLREAQSQVDLIQCFRGILSGLPFKIVYEHGYGHQDKNISWNLLTLLQQLNIIANQLAKDALWRTFCLQPVYLIQSSLRELSDFHQWSQSHILDLFFRLIFNSLVKEAASIGNSGLLRCTLPLPPLPHNPAVSTSTMMT